MKQHDFLTLQRRYWVVSRLWTRFCDSDSRVKDLVQEMTISSQEIPLAAWSSLLSQRQQFLNNHLAPIPVTPNQQRTHEMRDEVLPCVGAQDMDTNGYRVSADLDEAEFYWGNDEMEVHDVLERALILAPHQQYLTTWRWQLQQKTPFCSMERKTRRTLLLPQQHQSLRRQLDPLHCWEIVHLEQE